jgi:hypothetical protein
MKQENKYLVKVGIETIVFFIVIMVYAGNVSAGIGVDLWRPFEVPLGEEYHKVLSIDIGGNELPMNVRLIPSDSIKPYITLPETITINAPNYDTQKYRVDTILKVPDEIHGTIEIAPYSADGLHVYTGGYQYVDFTVQQSDSCPVCEPCQECEVCEPEPETPNKIRGRIKDLKAEIKRLRQKGREIERGKR